jgi:AcrR family transcriptional regulator
MQTREHRRTRILEAAFEEWGKRNFASTSLTHISRRLRITKPALYRYFSSKQGLIRALEDTFMEAYAAMHADFIAAVEDQGLERFVLEFVRCHYRFFSENKFYYHFYLLHMMRRSQSLRPKLHQFEEPLQRMLEQRLDETGAVHLAEEIHIRIRYLYYNAIFWLSGAHLGVEYHTERPREEYPSPRVKISAHVIDSYLEYAGSICLNGILRADEPEPDRALIEKEAAVESGEMLPRDRLFSAIESMVAEVGLEEASIDKIAAKIGMSKSSLYFYFQNKNDMLGQTIGREQEHIAGLIQAKVLPRATFSERSYAYMVVTASYTLNNPSLITVFNWLRFQNIGHKVNPPSPDYVRRFFTFFTDAAEAGQLSIPGGDTIRAASFLHVLAFREVMDYRQGVVPKTDLFARLRALHRLYLHGISPNGRRAAPGESREVKE